MSRVGHIAFVATSKPMLHLLLDEKPAMMGGAELQLFLHAQHLVSKGWEVTFVTGNYEEGPERTQIHGMNLIRSPLPARKPLARINALGKFWNTLREVDADIYITRGLTGQAGVVALFCKKAGKRYIFWFGKDADAWYGDLRASPLGAIEKRLAAFGIRNAFEVVVQSEQQSRLLLKHIGRAGYLIRNLCPREAHGMPPLEDRGIHSDSTVLWVGSLQPKKRPEMVFELAQTLPHQQFVMVGGGLPDTQTFAENIRREASRYQNVHFEGFVPYSQIYQYFRRAALFLNTSQPDLEGFPNTYLQAWSCGIPVVGTCDPDEVICQFNLGRHCNTVAELADAIKLLQTSPVLREKCGKAAIRYVEERHSARAVSEALDLLMEHALSS